MAGKISFHFDDGYRSHYTEAFGVFQKFGVPGCLCLIAGEEYRGEEKGRITTAQALEMQSAGWEILCHSRHHLHMNEVLPEEVLFTELVESKRLLEEEGYQIRQFVTPMSQCHPSAAKFLRAHYDGAFTVYKNSREMPVEELVLGCPVKKYRMHRACLAGKSAEELREAVDFVAKEDEWLVFYDHDLGVKDNITVPGLEELLAYCREKGVAVVTSSQALDEMKCTTDILQEGYDGKECFVHARTGVCGDRILITSQLMDVSGSDCFECLQVNYSDDGGRSWTGFAPDEAFSSLFSTVNDIKIRTICCDMTPTYHKKSGKFIVTGHQANYHVGDVVPVSSGEVPRDIPYAIFDEERKKFTPVQFLKMPDPVKYCDGGSGCSQILELDSGDLLIPIYFRETGDGDHSKVTVLRCSFDGETMQVLEIGDELDVPEEVRGLGEPSVIAFGGEYFLTLRADAYGYVCKGKDGLHYSAPELWRWEDGEILPTYNTQSHWAVCGGKLLLVYTRRAGFNDHVFRHRAPLFVAEVDPETLRVKRETEFVAVPERGARLGNFGVCDMDGQRSLVTVTEWMQPAGCEAYGSDNALWLSQVRLPLAKEKE